MTKHVGWLGLLLGLTLVPSACGSDDDDTGTGGAAGTGGGSSAGKGGGSSAGKGGGSNAGKGGANGEAGTGGSSGEANAAGNGGEAGEGQSEPLEISGTWKNDDFDETDIIDSDSWSQNYGAGPVVSAIVEYSNSENYLVRLAPHDAVYDADTYDRTVWTELDGDTFYYCTPDHGLATAEDAAASSTPVDTDDLDAGCDGFPWTQLTPK